MKEEILCYCSVCHTNQYFKKISMAATTRKHVRAQYQCEKCGNKNIYEFPVK